MINQRSTKQKQIIKDVLLSERTHLTADQVLEKIDQQGIKIGRATVFRNLKQLVKTHEIGYIPVVDSAAYFDYCNHNHYHFKCNDCKKLYDTPIEYQNELNSLLKNFDVHKHELTFYGVCEHCKNKTYSN